MNKISSLHISITMVALTALLLISVVLVFLPGASAEELQFDQTFYWFILAGFLAQLVDGALGMAYGLTSTSFLLSFGLSPKLASAAVHTAEVFTSGASGLAHIKLGNFDKQLFLKLVIPGTLAAAAGAFVLGNLVDGGILKPYISSYLLILGVLLVLRAFRKPTPPSTNLKQAPYLALLGGFLDAIGGGGWGPIVSSNLIHKGHTPRIVIGTVNTAEFFVTFCSAGVLIFFTGIQSWQIILGLIIGGCLASPLGAIIAKKLPYKYLIVAVGLLISTISLLTLIRSLA